MGWRRGPWGSSFAPLFLCVALMAAWDTNLPSLKSGHTIESGKHVQGPASNLTKFGPVEGFGPKPSTRPLRLSYGDRALPKMAF